TLPASRFTRSASRFTQGIKNCLHKSCKKRIFIVSFKNSKNAVVSFRSQWKKGFVLVFARHEAPK
ncbi:MAG: hypothetical protein KAQ78_06405, partial [Candidatus Latescibacteria bacterium]|nr:hypothetical protein [Candidatus Latescibacterota bacterium]